MKRICNYYIISMLFIISAINIINISFKSKQTFLSSICIILIIIYELIYNIILTKKGTVYNEEFIYELTNTKMEKIRNNIINIFNIEKICDILLDSDNNLINNNICHELKDNVIKIKKHIYKMVFFPILLSLIFYIIMYFDNTFLNIRILRAIPMIFTLVFSFSLNEYYRYINKKVFILYRRLNKK